MLIMYNLQKRRGLVLRFCSELRCFAVLLSWVLVTCQAQNMEYFIIRRAVVLEKKVVLKNFYSNWKWKLVAQSSPTLCDPMDCSPPGCSVLGILQARLLEWVAISFSRGSFWPWDRPRSPTLKKDSLPTELVTTREKIWLGYYFIFSMI